MSAMAIVLFGLFWTGGAVMITRGMGGIGLFFPLFGVVFVLVGIARVIYHMKNAKGKDRFLLIDIVDEVRREIPLTDGSKMKLLPKAVKDTARLTAVSSTIAPIAVTSLTQHTCTVRSAASQWTAE